MGRGIAWRLLAAMVVLGVGSSALAKKTSTTLPAAQAGEPQITYVGYYINDVYELDLKRSTYTVDFYIWLRWQGNLDPSNFEFMNGTLDLKEHPYHIDVGGVHYVSYHCRGTFHILFDYRRYPLDEHQLVMEMEDAEYESWQMKYVIDEANMVNLKPVTLMGWNCGDPTLEVQEHRYNTNFGEPTEKTGASSTYSRVYGAIHIARQGDSIYVKTFLGLFISVAISFLSFLFKPSETDPRFAVGVASIFGAVSSEIVATGNLPDMPYLTLADKIHLFSLFVIFLSLLQSCLSLRLFHKNRHETATRIDRISLIAFPMCYAAVVVLLTILD